jgi:lipopolysaccharide transport system permease protein
MVGIIDGFRWCILQGQTPINTQSLLTSIVVSLLFLWLGLYQFRKMERSFADLI